MQQHVLECGVHNMSQVRDEITHDFVMLNEVIFFFFLICQSSWKQDALPLVRHSD